MTTSGDPPPLPPPVDPAAGLAWRMLLLAGARLLAQLERDAAEAGVLPVTWFDVLMTLQATAGHRLRLCDLADAMLLTRAGLTRLVDRVEAAGFLRREAVPGDGRGAFAVLTPAGAAAVRRAWPTFARTIQDRFARHLTPAAAAALTDALRGVLAANDWLPDARPVPLNVPPRRRPAGG